MILTCTMLEAPSPDDPKDVACGKPAAYRYRKASDHAICADCYNDLQDDPDIQAEYEAL